MTHTLRIAERGRRFSPLVFAAGLLAGLFLADPARGQSAAQTLQIEVSEAAEAGRVISVPVSKSVIVDFSSPVREARIVNQEVAEVDATSPQQLVVTGRSFGVTQLIVWADDEEKHIFDVAVDLEMDRLQASIRRAVPRATVTANSVMDSVVLTGTVPDAEAGQRIVEIASLYSPKVMNQMQVAGTQQVLLRVTVAEVNRTAMRQLGFNGWIAGDNFRDMFFLSNLNQINPTNMGAAGGVNVTQRIPLLTGEGGIPVSTGTTMSFGFPRGQMQFFVQALRENGLLRILAEPNLVAINGQSATFLAGGEYPIPIVTDERIKVEYKRFGIQLNFTPAILGPDSIRLRVAPEISEPDLANAVTVSGFVIPSFITRRVETVVELGPGQTIAIGGLLSDRVRGVSSKVPGLGDLPVLGSLFTSTEFQEERTELVVLVTPELADAVSPDQVTYVPGADILPPNDFELFLLGKIEGAPDANRPALTPLVHHDWPVRPSDLYGNDNLNLKLRGPLGPASEDEGS